MQSHSKVLWFTGLSAAGKTTIARALDAELKQRACRSCILDGDDLRAGLNGDLGFSEQDRSENIRRVAEVAKLFLREGHIVLVALISPLRVQRDAAREIFALNEFVEVFVDAPLDVCESRDPKGLYKRARKQDLSLFTGIDSPYEPPLNPELHLHSDSESPNELVNRVIGYLESEGAL